VGEPLPRGFYARPTEDVAVDLLGSVLYRRTGDQVLAGRIVEVEAYGGDEDPGSHAYRGRTERNATMFTAPGHLYVYRTYYTQICMNVVCETEGVPGAVLVRALEPMQGLHVMERNRGGRSGVELCNGPAKLCQALNITLTDDGVDLTGQLIWIEEGDRRIGEIAVTTRVGLSRGIEAPLRFFLSGNRYVSPGKPSGGDKPKPGVR
jgi:DNA-3-methyladenine glycosylase